ncbi:hypothetical protein SSS_09783, partial [Sarcoptes scabiei]
FVSIQLILFNLITIWIVCFQKQLDLIHLNNDEHFDCRKKIDETLVQICTNFHKKNFIGKLCSMICEVRKNYSETQIKLLDCPTQRHIGKRSVIFASDSNINSNVSSLVIKSREVFLEKLLSDSSFVDNPSS